jgi:heme exporter protein D
MSAALGPYASFIIASYALAALVVAALTLWVALDFRRQTQALRDLEASGITRRSARPPGDRS